MASLSSNNAALRVGINYHMRRLNKNAVVDVNDSDVSDDSDLDDLSDLSDDDVDSDDFDGFDDSDDSDGSGNIVQPRDLFFDVDTTQKTVEKASKTRFRDAANSVVRKLQKAVRCKAYKMHPECFDDNFHYDFTKILTDQKRFSRGGTLYNRPLGSMRYGLNVVDKYENNDWLGRLDVEGQTTNSSVDGEWPVAYHGTTDPRAAEILASGGLDMKKGVRFAYGYGIYCTPNPGTALAYASPYRHGGKTYKLILQARVDPAHRKIAPGTDYWIIKKNDAIRPYGICVYPC